MRRGMLLLFAAGFGLSSVAHAGEPYRKPWRAGRVVAWSFVPVPGLPSLLQRDPAGAGVAWAVAVPTAVWWVGAVRNTARHPAEEISVSIAGAYAATVVANQITGQWSRQRAAVAVLPRPEGGATVQVIAQF